MSKDNTKQTENSTYPVTTEEFVETVSSATSQSEIPQELYRHYVSVMERSVDFGRTCTKERMAKLYPIFREICEEIDETEAFYQKCEEKDRREERKAARLAKQNQLQAAA